MPPLLVYRARAISTEDVAFIRGLLASHPEEGRCAIARRVCQAWDWRQPNGFLKEIICRGLLLRLEREGHLVLPPRSGAVVPRRRRRPAPVAVDTSPIKEKLAAIAPDIVLTQVRRTVHEPLWGSLVEQYHYLGYRQPVGEHLKYLVWLGERPIGCLAFSSAAYGLSLRDNFIGWSAAERERNRHLLAYNTRFLILPWVRVKFLASHLLARSTRQLAAGWQALYRHPVHWVETFVDTERFRGTCYQAANWIRLGQTCGRGKYNKTHRQLVSRKDIYGLPLTPDFRRLLAETP